MTPEQTDKDEQVLSIAAGPLESYRSAMAGLTTGQPIDSDGVLAALVARDRVAVGGPLRPAEIQELASWDEKLRETAEAITSKVGRQTLSTWQRSVDPNSERWWWSLHLIPETPTRKTRWLGRLSAVVLVVSFFYMTNLVELLLKVTAISEGLFALAVQSLLLYVVSRGLTESGLARVRTALARFSLLKAFQPGRRAAATLMLVASLLILAVTLLARSMVPEHLAASYRTRGDSARAREAWYQAIDDYSRATLLEPDDPATRYGLAVAYDESRQFERAIEEYNAAARIDGAPLVRSNLPRYASTINGLARLYIVHRKEPSEALDTLYRLDTPLKDGLLSPEANHTLLRNRGWAKLELGLRQAQHDLRAALNVRTSASARFLLGRALVALGQPEDARKQFDEMIRLVVDDPTRERELDPTWIIEAQQRLRETDGAREMDEK